MRGYARLLPVLSITVLLIVASGVVPSAGQSEAVEFTVKLAQGESLFYAVTQVTQSVLEATGLPGGPTRDTTETTFEAREVLRVFEVGADGSMQVEVSREEARRTSRGRTQEITLKPEMLFIRADGRLLDSLGGKETEHYYLDLPGRSVRVGESWTRQERTVEDQITVEVTRTFTLDAIETSGEARVARIRDKTEGTISGRPSNMLFPTTGRGTIKQSGNTYWSIEGGRLIRSDLEWAIDIQMDATAPGLALRVRGTDKTTARREAMSPESIKPPTVPPELLVVPGKSVGAVTLDAPVADITSRLGASTANPPNPTMWGADQGFQAPTVSWPGAIVGYLDPADRTRLVGVATTDRRHRTDKGVGYGSSQGAVLTAYGMSPLRAQVSGAQGSVRLLIYNDQGIAFAINTDEKVTFGRAPTGTVDWTVVFAPGNAGKIISLP